MALVIARATFLVSCILSSADFVIRSICLAGDVFLWPGLLFQRMINTFWVVGLVFYLHFSDIIV